MAKGDHRSKTHPPVPNDPSKTNWVEQEGHLPEFIEAVARHIMADSGYPRSRAIAAAVSQTKKFAAKGNARAIKALAQWERMKASAHARPNKSTKTAGTAHMAVIEFSTVSYSSGPSQDERAKAQSKGQAFKSGRFPIRNLSDAKKAIHAFGRAKDEDKPALKRFIIRRLRALGHPELIPSSWSAKEMAALRLQVIELAGTRDRGIYKRHVKHTEQYGKKKGDLKSKADWKHGYNPLSNVAMALKAKHLSTDDLTSSGAPKPGKEKQLRLPVPPHLTKSKTDESRSSKERAREPGEVTHKEAKRQQPAEDEKAQPSVASLRRERARLEKKLEQGTATAAEKKRLNQVVSAIKKRARPVKPNPARG